MPNSIIKKHNNHHIQQTDLDQLLDERLARIEQGKATFYSLEIYRANTRAAVSKHFRLLKPQKQ
ncbi:hypothetical protein NGM44_02180 [Moraxella sp. FZFQ2102]|uniref:hypothetical protein n=1 Tax=Moraxella sp. FZFQ2102 TaxID=2953752 RepID=UPI00209BCA75|nr:hypothetical protein [Moraxella sp. FZFQ2102]USZ15223.1 hypothetical protein NGM44_02180 [Moraxella sp. FZFQ2102]